MKGWVGSPLSLEAAVSGQAALGGYLEDVGVARHELLTLGLRADLAHADGGGGGLDTLVCAADARLALRDGALARHCFRHPSFLSNFMLVCSTQI